MKSLVVAGVMSGTSADGVDVALCRIRASSNNSPKIKLIGHAHYPYSKAVRNAVLAAMDAKNISVAGLARLDWRLGSIYADCVEQSVTRFSTKPHLVGCHGQTLYHQSTASRYLGAPVRATWQTGQASVLAERLRIPVVSDLRPADLAAGGQGAPLVPMLDYALFRSLRISRVLQNLGGIANLTAIPANATPDDVMAFDTGPANMVIDACMQRLYNKPFDRNGAIARRGRVLRTLVDTLLRDPFFAAAPPKSCGREQFGDAFATRFLAQCRKLRANDEDILATATALTAESILDAYRRFVWSHLGTRAPLAKVESIVAGGGAKNATLMHMLRSGLEPLGVRLRSMEELGFPAQAKEAVAFALLAWLTWNRLPGNIPAATGAARPVLLGKITYA